MADYSTATILTGSTQKGGTALAGGNLFVPSVDDVSGDLSPLLNTYQNCVGFINTGVIRRFNLQDIAKQILPNSRCYMCMHRIAPGAAGVKVLYSDRVKRAHYGGLMVCGSVWICAVCSAKISERRKLELVEMVNNHLGGLALITFTLRHNRYDTLISSLAKLDKAYKLLVGGWWYQEFIKRWGLIGAAKNSEITYGELNGWNPHKHALQFYKTFLDDQSIEQIRKEITARWLCILAKVGASGLDQIAVDCQSVTTEAEKVAEYVAKWDKLPDKKPWGIEAEIAKSTVKKGKKLHLSFWQLLEWAGQDEEKLPVSLVREYAKATKGKHSLTFSKGLRAELGLGPEKTDLEIINEQDETAWIMAVLKKDFWRYVCENGKRAEILTIANFGDQNILDDYLNKLFISKSSEEKSIELDLKNYLENKKIKKSIKKPLQTALWTP